VKGFIRPLAVGLAATALAAAPAQAQDGPPGPPSPCPGDFITMPFTIAPEENKNGDLVVCVKFDPGQSFAGIAIDNPRPVLAP
jgi:hypothetical protein